MGWVGWLVGWVVGWEVRFSDGFFLHGSPQSPGKALSSAGAEQLLLAAGFLRSGELLEAARAFIG